MSLNDSIDLTKMELAPTESQILSQYQLLASQLRHLDQEIQKLTRTTRLVGDEQSADKLLDNYRNLEMKIGLVYNLFKGAVYLLFLQNEEDQMLNEQQQQDQEELDEHQEMSQELDEQESD